MKTTFWLLLGLFFIIYSSKPTIVFKPFSIEFASPYTPFGILFLILALSCFDLQSRKNGNFEAFEKYYKIGFKDGSDFTFEQINDTLKERGKDDKISIKRDVE